MAYLDPEYRKIPFNYLEEIKAISPNVDLDDFKYSHTHSVNVLTLLDR